MPLDFAVLRSTGSPLRTVPLSVNLHLALLTAASTRSLQGFHRFADYYADETVLLGDLPQFDQQIEIALANVDDADLRTFLDQLRDLVAFAISNAREVVTLAD